MKKIILIVACLTMSSAALAAPPIFLEFAYITGGENNNRGGNDQKRGYEFAGSWGFSNNWYAGGLLGHYDRDNPENDYLNINGGYVKNLNDKTDLILEGGFWTGEEKYDNGDKNKPKALEAKAGVSAKVIENFSVFGTMSIIGGDLDNGSNNEDISNFIWSLGGAYSFTDAISLNVKLVNGINGVNGQDEVLRIGGRWTFK